MKTKGKIGYRALQMCVICQRTLKNVVQLKDTAKTCNFATRHQEHYYIISRLEGERKFRKRLRFPSLVCLQQQHISHIQLSPTVGPTWQPPASPDLRPPSQELVDDCHGCWPGHERVDDGRQEQHHLRCLALDPDSVSEVDGEDRGCQSSPFSSARRTQTQLARTPSWCGTRWWRRRSHRACPAGSMSHIAST